MKLSIRILYLLAGLRSRSRKESDILGGVGVGVEFPRHLGVGVEFLRPLGVGVGVGLVIPIAVD